MAPTRQPPRIPRGPVIALGLTGSIAVGAIFWSHYSQVRDRNLMKEGVERDKLRMKLRKQQQKEERTKKNRAGGGG